MVTVDTFREQLEAVCLDPEGIHHELRSGLHGRKLDLGEENIPYDSPLHAEWEDQNVAYIKSTYDPQPNVIIGTANGTNCLAVNVARKLGGMTIGLETDKDPKDPNTIRLSRVAQLVLSTVGPASVLVLDDVGTTGFNAAQVALAVRKMGFTWIGVLYTYWRTEALPYLSDADIPTDAIIHNPLPTFTPEQCNQPGNPCAKGWDLIKRHQE
jgi:hypothetical protein